MTRRPTVLRRPADDAGVALLLVLVFVLVIAVLVGALLNQSFTTFRSARVAADIENRVFAANGGIDWGIQQLRDGVLVGGAPACVEPAQSTQTLTGAPLAINDRTVTVTCTVTAGQDAAAGGWSVFVTDPAGGIATWRTGQNDKAIAGAVYNAGSFTFESGTRLRVLNGRVVQRAATCVQPAALVLFPSPPYTFGPCSTTPVATPAPPVPLDQLPDTRTDPPQPPDGDGTSGGCRSFDPGHYTSALQALPNGAGVNHLRSGVYWFDNAGVIDLSDVAVVGGSPPPGEDDLTGATADVEAACGPLQTEAETGGHYGVVLVLGGNTTLRIRATSRVELYSFRAPAVSGAAGLSILQQPAPPSNGAIPTIVQMAPGSTSQVAIHGGIYTPTARFSAFGTASAWISATGGVVAAAVDLQAAPGPTNAEVSTPAGGGSRTIRLVATTNSVGGEKQIRAVADVVVVNDASRTVSVTSWRVEQ